MLAKRQGDRTMGQLTFGKQIACVIGVLIIHSASSQHIVSETTYTRQLQGE